MRLFRRIRRSSVDYLCLLCVPVPCGLMVPVTSARRKKLRPPQCAAKNRQRAIQRPSCEYKTGSNRHHQLPVAFILVHLEHSSFFFWTVRMESGPDERCANCVVARMRWSTYTSIVSSICPEIQANGAVYLAIRTP